MARDTGHSPQAAPPGLNDVQKTAVRAYGNGCFSVLAEMAGAELRVALETIDDHIFLGLMRELSTENGGDFAEQSLDRVEMAITSLTAVSRGLAIDNPPEPRR